MTTNRTDRRPVLVAMVATTVILAGIVLAASGPGWSMRRMWFWMIACTLSERLWVRLPLGRVTLSMSSCFNLAALLVLPRAEAMLAVAVSTALAEIAFMRKPTILILFNSAQTALAVAAGLFAFALLRGAAGRQGAIFPHLNPPPIAAG